MVGNLLSTNASLIKQGKQQLLAKDQEIAAIQDETKILIKAKDEEINKYIKLSKDAAATSDANQSQIDKMNSWGGIGAIFYGFKRLIVRLAWGLGIFAVLFIILRLAASANPICGAIFSVFEHVASWFINTIRVIFPKALAIAGNVSKELYEKSTTLLKKIIDNVQQIKVIEKRLGRDITLKELLLELDKSLDEHEKKSVADIKKQLGY